MSRICRARDIQRWVMIVVASCLLVTAGTAQQTIENSTTVPTLVKFSGQLLDANSAGRTGTVGVTFAIYKELEGGAPLWIETQNVELSNGGHYTVTLGASKSSGLPNDLFASGEARWVGVKADGESERARVMLVSVPYALKARDAETIGGLPPSAFVRTVNGGTNGAQSNRINNEQNPIPPVSGGGKTDYLPIWNSPSKLGSSVVFQSGKGSGAEVGVNTNSPTATLDVKGTTHASGNAGIGIAPSSTGYTPLSISDGSTFGTWLSVGNTSSGHTWNFISAGSANAEGAGNLGITDLKGNSTIWLEGNVNVTRNTGLGAAASTNGYTPLTVGDASSFGTWLALVNASRGGHTWNFISAGSDNSEGAGNLGIGDLTGASTIWLEGNVNVSGNLSKGGGSFKIDHPLDPANKYLYHSFVESPDMMDVYNGNVRTNSRGIAVVTLPDYFEALNRDFRYQLTVVGQFAQAIVAKEISQNRFTIKTNRPNVKVSWNVTGIRQDAYANAHRIPVEEEKSASERGKYLHPELFGHEQQDRIGRF